MKPVDAIYREVELPEHKGNPLIEALPSMLSDKDIIYSAGTKINYDLSEKELPKHLRLHCLSRLKYLIIPTPIYIDFGRDVSNLIASGYVSRNPQDAETWQMLMSRAYKNNGIIPPPSNFSSTAGSSLVTGLSGIGKSTVIEKTLYRYPQTIRHKNYKGKPFDHTQIVWIKIDCPFNSTIKGLAYSFFEEIDQLLGTNYLDEVKKPKNNASILQNKMENIVSTYFIGVIVIDELQHLKSAKSGNAEEMQNFFVNLVNKVGIPIIYSGTYSVKKVLSSELKQARRVGTTHHLEPLEFNSPLFDYFIKSLWQYQWVKKVQDLNDDIFSVIHELTQGIPAFIISLFANAQAYAIESETEIINIETLNKAFENKMTSLHPAINALRSGRERDLLKFEDLIPIDFDLINSNPTEEELIEELFSAQGQPPKKDAPTKGKDTKIIPIQKDTKVDIDSKFNPDEYLADDA